MRTACARAARVAFGIVLSSALLTQGSTAEPAGGDAPSTPVFKYRDVLRIDADNDRHGDPDLPLVLVLGDSPALGVADTSMPMSVCEPGNGVCFESTSTCFAIPRDGKMPAGQEWQVNGNRYRLKNVLEDYRAFGRAFGTIYVVEQLSPICKGKFLEQAPPNMLRIYRELLKEQSQRKKAPDAQTLYYYSPIHGLIAIVTVTMERSGSGAAPSRDVSMSVIDGSCGFGHSDTCTP